MLALALKGPAVALAAMLFVFSLIPTGPGFQSEIYGHQGSIFYGVASVKGEKLPLVVEVEAPEPKKEPEKAPEKPQEPPKPGRVKITFQRKGEDIKIIYDHTGGDIAEEDRERVDKVVDAILKYSEHATKKSVSSRVIEALKGMKATKRPSLFWR